jgi:hypothetical protein
MKRLLTVMWSKVVGLAVETTTRGMQESHVHVHCLAMQSARSFSLSLSVGTSLQSVGGPTGSSVDVSVLSYKCLKADTAAAENRLVLANAGLQVDGNVQLNTGHFGGVRCDPLTNPQYSPKSNAYQTHQ